MAELMTVGPVLIAGGSVLASDNTRSTASKLFRYIRDKLRIRRMYSNRWKLRGLRYSVHL